MEINQKKSIIEAILFAAGRPVEKNELVFSIRNISWRYRYNCKKYARRI